MIEYAITNNGSTDLPISMSESGILLPEGGLEDMNASAQRTIIYQIKNSLLAEKFGFHYCFFTEHHFQPEGNEYSPNPILLGTAIAARTKYIRLGQAANILSWWHPIRLAEQAAMLDVISGGRLEFGVGRGLQPRETEVFARQYGSSSTNELQSIQFFEEALSVIVKAWTKPSFSHHGRFFSFPEPYTAHHHPMTMEYFSRPGAGRTVEDVLEVGGRTASPIGIYSHATTMKELQVLPRPLQQPHPQIWQPVVMSVRSMDRAARLGMNAMVMGSGPEAVNRDVETYMRAAETCGWPDRLGRGEFKRGWDCSARRGVAHVQAVHLTGKGIGNADRFKQALASRLQYLSHFLPENAGFNKVQLSMESLSEGIAFVGGPQQIIDSFMRLKELGGYDDFLCAVSFEGSGLSGSEVTEQIQCFGEEVMPVLSAACGGAFPRVEPDPRFAI